MAIQWQFDGHETFAALDAALEDTLSQWLAAPVPAQLRTLLGQTEAFVQGYMDLDPLGRSDSYLIAHVPLSAIKRRFLKQALSHATPRSKVLRAYLTANGLWAPKKKPTPAKKPKKPPARRPRHSAPTTPSRACPSCDSPLVLLEETLIPCGVDVPNPVGLRDTWRRRYVCSGCEQKQQFEDDC